MHVDVTYFYDPKVRAALAWEQALAYARLALVVNPAAGVGGEAITVADSGGVVDAVPRAASMLAVASSA